jgi:predicted RecA/RadA family phage recombinase
MADYLPLFRPGHQVTYTAKAAVVGGQVVVVSGDRQVSPSSGASAAVVGVAGCDAAVGQRVTVESDGVQLLTASTAVAAGDLVSAAANGAVAKLAGSPVDPTLAIGVALTSAAAGAPVQIKMK